ncbi:MAG: DUF5685 family protein [Oscillospiraceae bacterium]|nr:DUF5685 family protein [Oscillospiraceae bacterium]
MFGYIRPMTGQLRVSEYETYRAVYCSICHALKENFGALSTLSLNYDFTFAALLGLAMREDFPGYEPFACIAHPLHKRQRLKNERKVLPFISGCVVSMVHAKVADNIADAGSFKSFAFRLTFPFTAHAGKKADRLYPGLMKICTGMNDSQQKVEALSAPSLDAAAEPSAHALSEMMEMLSDDPLNRRVLSRFGYLLGRWIYIIDALDDLKDDLKEKGFNPFAVRFSLSSPEEFEEKREEILRCGKELLNVTGAEMAAAYELLPLKRFKGILDNIVYLGLNASMERVLNPKKTASSAGDPVPPSAVSLT